MANDWYAIKLRETRKLKRWLFEQGITRCEWPRGCTNTLGLAPAHRLKQRRIRTIEEVWMAALLCGSHHHFIEYGDRKHKGTHRRMFRLITMIILRRKIQYGRTFDSPQVDDEVEKVATGGRDRGANIHRPVRRAERHKAIRSKGFGRPAGRSMGMGQLPRTASTGSGTMKEEIDGYRRTSVKTRDRAKIDQKIEEFEERGKEVIVKESAGYFYLYVKKEQPLGVK